LHSSSGRRFLPITRRGGGFQRVGRASIAAALVFGTGITISSAAAQPQPATSPSGPPGTRPFQPGVCINWAQRAVYVDGHVVLRQGPIEFLACLPGKEHESIVRLDAPATYIYMALGLVGLEPGHPPRWDEQRGRFGPPAGDLIDVAIEWEEGGRRRTAAGFQWLRDFEFARIPIDRPWVFAGSRRLRDGTLSADHGGDCIAVVDKPDSLLALSRNHVSRDAELWAQANTEAIPPLHTAVRIVLRPAQARSHQVRVDFRGATFVDGRYAHPEDVADLVKLARYLSPEYVQRIQLEGTLPSDQARLRQALAAAGVPPGAMRFVRCKPSPQPPRPETP